ncbi:hypothetical protein [Mycobacterium sp. MMS18-G62]
MDSPRSGFRRAAAASWALAGLGIASVGGASVLAYADTVKPPPADVPIDAVEQAPPVPAVPEVAPSMTEAPPPPPPPPPVTTEPPAPETTVEQAPISTYKPVPTYTPEQTVEQAPATQQAQAPTKVTAPPTTQRRILTPTTVMAPNFSPHVTRSRGS